MLKPRAVPSFLLAVTKGLNNSGNILNTHGLFLNNGQEFCRFSVIFFFVHPFKQCKQSSS